MIIELTVQPWMVVVALQALLVFVGFLTWVYDNQGHQMEAEEFLSGMLLAFFAFAIWVVPVVVAALMGVWS